MLYSMFLMQLISKIMNLLMASLRFPFLLVSISDSFSQMAE